MQVKDLRLLVNRFGAVGVLIVGACLGVASASLIGANFAR